MTLPQLQIIMTVFFNEGSLNCRNTGTLDSLVRLGEAKARFNGNFDFSVMSVLEI